MSNVVSTYIKYKQKRAEIKARQKVELEKELEGVLTDFGLAILEGQAKGKRIEDIEYEIGAKNRNLVYAAKRLAKKLDIPAPTPGSPAPSQPLWELVRVEHGYNVYITEGLESNYKGKITVNPDSHATTAPEEWALDTANVHLYRQIITEVKELVAQW